MDKLFIFIGGFIGASTRYAIGNVMSDTIFPISTFLMNVIGCFLLAFILTYCTTKMREEYILLLGTGFAGSFTTFSTFSLETVQLLDAGRIIVSISYIVCSIGCGLVASFIGYYLSKKLVNRVKMT